MESLASMSHVFDNLPLPTAPAAVEPAAKPLPPRRAPGVLSRNRLLLISWLVPALVLVVWELAARAGYLSIHVLPARFTSRKSRILSVSSGRCRLRHTVHRQKEKARATSRGKNTPG